MAAPSRSAGSDLKTWRCGVRGGGRVGRGGATVLQVTSIIITYFTCFIRITSVVHRPSLASYILSLSDIWKYLILHLSFVDISEGIFPVRGDIHNISERGSHYLYRFYVST